MLDIFKNISRRLCCLMLGKEGSVAWWWASPSWSSPSSSPSSPPAFATAAAAPSSLSQDHFRSLPSWLDLKNYWSIFRALLLCFSQWGWWPTPQGGDLQRFDNSPFYTTAIFKYNLDLRLWKCVRTPIPLCLAIARWEVPTGWQWPALSAPSSPPPSPSSPTSPPRATRPCTGGRMARSSSASHEVL